MSVSNTADEGSNPSARAKNENPKIKMRVPLIVAGIIRKKNLKKNTVASIIQYIEESFNELVHKVTWPTWDQLQSSSIVVLVASVIFSLIIFVMDYLFGINMTWTDGQPTFSLWRGILGFYYDFVGAY